MAVFRRFSSLLYSHGVFSSPSKYTNIRKIVVSNFSSFEAQSSSPSSNFLFRKINVFKKPGQFVTSFSTCPNDVGKQGDKNVANNAVMLVDAGNKALVVKEGANAVKENVAEGTLKTSQATSSHFELDCDSVEITEDTLNEKWRDEKSLQVNKDDLTIGMKLLTKIAAETVEKVAKSKSTDTSGFPFETVPLCKLVAKIKIFIENNAYAFRKICQTGFPFSLLEGSSAKMALKHALTDYNGSILASFLLLEDGWLNEKELNERFASAFQRCELSEIAIACYTLKESYIKNGDNKAGYYLLWLIKQAIGGTYEIPEKDSFNNSTVAKVLSQFVDSGFLTNATNFVEILYYRDSLSDTLLYEEFLVRIPCTIFLDFTMRQLQNIPMDQWPNKASIIVRLLETLTPESNITLAKSLASSQDMTTSIVGYHLFTALTARSLKEAAPHFHALLELVPHIHIQSIFGRPFIAFCHNKSIFKKDPEFTRRLNFNSMRRVFVHDSLMIGVYRSHIAIPPHLLAYDMNTEKMAWGIPLVPMLLEDPFLNTSAASGRTVPADYSLEKVGNYLALQFVGEQELYFIHPETGEIDSTLVLPEVSESKYNCLHISSKGFGYQMVYRDQDRVLIGGTIRDKQWHRSFEVKTPWGLFHPLSTHCGIQQDVEDTLILFGPTGDQVTLNCMATEARGDKLYSIEKDPADKNKCLLTIRTLKTDKEVVSGVEQSIVLNVKKATFGNFCQNGQLVLLSENFSNASPIFVDLNNQEVTYSQHAFPSAITDTLITDSGELWTWDEISRKIWKVSRAHITLMGSLESGRGTTLLHADHRLFFIAPNSNY